uniref:Alpha-amylase n=1 Tax=Phlebotomus papatasi TaxID=29031 RepID=A0A1B0EY97_PHLPP
MAVIAVEDATLLSTDPNFKPGRSVIVHLFEWKWVDIAEECERFLGPNGFGGVQVSSPAENAIVTVLGFNRPWWERYHIISYILETRSGNEEQFADMVRRCNAVGVRIYPDAVFNHMGSLPNMIGTGGSTADGPSRSYPAVPYDATSFHESCPIDNYQDAENVRNCELFGAPDLNQELDDVREKIVAYLDHLITLGVAGFRVDSAKHIWPSDLEVIYGRVRNLNTDHDFPENSRPFFYHEVIDAGGEAISKYEYIHLSAITDFLLSYSIGFTFRGNNLLDTLQNWGQPWGFLPSYSAIAFVENHDNERGVFGDQYLTYKDGKPYRMAVAFNLAHPHGITRIMSSFDFPNDNIDQSPPMDENQNIISPSINPDGSCGNGWVCQHRWRQIYNMVKFRNVAMKAKLTNWWSNRSDQIAFARNGCCFIAFNNEGRDMMETLQTSLPPGTYCDVITGNAVDGACTGKTITVQEDGTAVIGIGANEEDGVLAIHICAKISLSVYKI